jgi:hypothetical protein
MSDSKLKPKSNKRKKPPPKKHGSAKKVRKTKSKTKKKSKKDHYDGDSDYSDLDLSKDVKPIGVYVKDREEMIQQMFKAVQGPTLKGMIPDILKKVSVDDLKQLCLEQLEVMSRKRIRKILDGQDPETISSSGTEDESSDESMQIQDNNVGSQNSSGVDAAENEDESDQESDAESVAQSTHAADSTSDPRLDGADADLPDKFEKDFDDAASHQSSVVSRSDQSESEQPVTQDEPAEENGNVPAEAEPVKVKKTRLVKKPKPIRTEEAEEGELTETEYEEVTDDETEREAEPEVMAEVEKDEAVSDAGQDKNGESAEQVQKDEEQEEAESDAKEQSEDAESIDEAQPAEAESEPEAAEEVQSEADGVQSEAEDKPDEPAAMESETQQEVVEVESDSAEAEEEEEEMEAEEQDSEKEQEAEGMAFWFMGPRILRY